MKWMSFQMLLFQKWIRIYWRNVFNVKIKGRILIRQPKSVNVPPINPLKKVVNVSKNRPKLYRWLKNSHALKFLFLNHRKLKKKHPKRIIAPKLATHLNQLMIRIKLVIIALRILFPREQLQNARMEHARVMQLDVGHRIPQRAGNA